MTKKEMIDAMSTELKHFKASKEYAMKVDKKRIEEVYNFYLKELERGVNKRNVQAFCLSVI